MNQFKQQKWTLVQLMTSQFVQLKKIIMNCTSQLMTMYDYPDDVLLLEDFLDDKLDDVDGEMVKNARV